MKKRLFLLCLLAVSLLQANAENHGRYLELGIGGGLHSMQYTGFTGNNSTTPGGGGQLYLTYRYMFHEHWGIGAGFDLTYLHASATFDHTDGAGHAFGDWKEQQNLLNLNIPVGIYFQTPVCEKWDFMWGTGAKLSFHEYNNFYASGRMDDVDRVFGGHIAEKDFPKIGCELYADLGFHYAVSERILLYIGLYGSYGPTNHKRGTDTPLYAVNKDDKGVEHGIYHGMLNSDACAKAHSYTVGLKFGITFNFLSQSELDALPDEELGTEDEENRKTWHELEME